MGYNVSMQNICFPTLQMPDPEISKAIMIQNWGSVKIAVLTK